ncbi:MAG: sigma-70 family RNA polymerase sigma factor [Kiritimatiellia bacterium]
MEQADAELISRYRAGEVEALETLVLKYRRRLMGFIINTGGARDDADEVFQEVWLKAIRNIHRYRRKNFLGWLVRIARNTMVDRSRKKKPDALLDTPGPDGGCLMDKVASAGANPSEAAAAGEVGRRIAEAVSGLSAEQKEVFVLRTGTELPFREIAKVQGVSLNTVLGRMHYAVQKLRNVLKDDYLCLRSGRSRQKQD